MRRELDFLALVRTSFSAERSAMAWMRTSVSLYAFGFSLTKFFDYLEGEMGSEQSWVGPRRFGLLLVGLGILALILATVEQLRRSRKIRGLGLPAISRLSLPIVAAAALLVIGVTTLIGSVIGMTG